MANRQQKGFTLLEMVITIATLAVLAMLVTPYLSLSARAYNDNSAGLKVLGELRYASERIAREIRDIRRDQFSSANYDIVTPLVPNSIVFFRNDGERVTIEDAAPMLNLRYFSLQADAAFPLSTSLQNITFNYFTNDEVTPTVNSNDVAYIEFEIQLLANGQTYSQRSRVALRAQP